MLLTIFLAIFLFVFAMPVYAQETAKITDILTVIQNIIRLLAPITAVIFLVMTIYGGFMFVRSRGEPKNVETARNVLQFAIIGAILVVASWLVLVFIAQTVGCDVTIVSFSNC